MKDQDDERITPELLLQAYMSGIFPMAESRDDTELFWVDPRRRGIFPLDQFHISRSLARALRRPDHRVSVNTDFAGVLEGCADRAETWINDEIADLYLDLHRRGYAGSVEVWDMDDTLVGGVYGVTLGRAFFGESMFSRRTNASKIALAWLVDRLNLTGFTVFDTQFLTTHLASLGAIEVSRARYHAMLAEALQGAAEFDPPGLVQTVEGLLARNAGLSHGG
ncbi:leucyl/phenylalanyl-tRNA--protein transferase [Pseudooceanicola sediminis]|uniref:Leucyl/phenylalanyl-tRNA--protein transferase n=1 Tax=Pseudooceanicola sediminis TaxID=2211117 RepID=A0A399J4C0_9RHOB|nr:leucyl/phenylalanyl-tRNA--protein transferase [Pseudooceanicola sediminis]KAA2313138.1 leucyl/phenylalanyl-tRNA--protein transferase [Puniceibacterium sp. HSS470]RII37786.1 leucyl/phenylalanyl-tRNA--protein transferase [Pseudooceanicola sediminis]|tara:strand:- start:84729 stop:85394 length:666 start_codon:yes stop_codon:yes gene_type:complete